ncbi:glycosyltransferase [Paraclostridium bifermentans]|uniref:glycosyltransferase n=1 Tax=Paraclostridium bifermentans TaxID=1490 RepID=UPI00115A3693|nr:glycosyltransferase [Paraclostridium bifermentans]TQO58787.1 glycosyltransferase [Paraclostridium bifermentans]
MKVLQINSVCGVGSTGRIATDLYKVLEENGHSCKIAYGRGNAPEHIDSIKIGTNFDNYLHVFKTRVFDEHGFGSVAATKEFIEEVRKYDPDIIHLHNIHGYYINIKILFEYIREANKPVIWTLHDCWAFTGHCAYFDFVGCDKWKYECEKCPQKSVYPTSKVKDNSKLNYEQKKKIFTSINNMTIVTPSNWLANLVKESFLGKYNVKVVNNGIDLDVFKPTESNFRKKYDLQDEFIILGVASDWSERKGLKYFIDLQKVLSEKYKIVIVGVNKKQQKMLPKEIISITRTNNTKELAEIYTSADVFLNPTVQDNFPTTNLESLACGTPVITFETGGSPESINNKCGIVIKNKTILEIKDAIRLLKENKISLDSCTNNSKKYDKNERYSDYIFIYKKIKSND